MPVSSDAMEGAPRVQPYARDVPLNANGIDGTLEILLVEDNPADARLTREVFEGGRLSTHLNVVSDGEQALAFLRREGIYETAPRPKLVLLDLNLPRKNGLEVLDEMRADAALAVIPVIMLTSSSARHDVEAAYAHGANAFVVKPQDLDSFMDLIGTIRGFWLGVAQLPSG
jgi:two-component system, chemotaxis family, response regulator Rcp1